MNGVCRVDTAGLGEEPVSGFCENGDEPWILAPRIYLVKYPNYFLLLSLLLLLLYVQDVMETGNDTSTI
jgi:hypothetical protein